MVSATAEYMALFRALESSVPVFLEVDRPEVQALKRELPRDRAGDGVCYAPCDFEAGSLAESRVHSRGYEFYRAAIATIPGSAGPARDDGRSRDAQGQS